MTTIESLKEDFKQKLFELTGEEFYIVLRKKKNYIPKDNNLTPDIIIDFVSEYFKVAPDRIRNPKGLGKGKYLHMKYVCIFLVFEIGAYMKLNKIGTYFGNIHHSMVIHARETGNNYYTTDIKFKKDVDNIRNILLSNQNIPV